MHTKAHLCNCFCVLSSSSRRTIERFVMVLNKPAPGALKQRCELRQEANYGTRTVTLREPCAVGFLVDARLTGATSIFWSTPARR